MSAPSLVSVYPGDGSTGIPVGAPISLIFDRGIDTLSVKDYIVLYGPDFDQTSGADSVLFIDQDTGDNPFFLKSPGFKGLVDLRIEVAYIDLDTLGTVSPLVTGETDETSYSTSGIGHRINVFPVSGCLAPDVEYTLHILGDPDSQGTGISSRTIFDVVPNVLNTSDSGLVYSSGSYTGIADDTLNIEIITAGDIGVAKYRYWLSSAGIGEAVTDKLTNRRYRSLSNGVQVRFSGTDFAIGDLFTINLEPAQRLATTTKITFTTNDGSYSLPPDSPSTPAESEPPSTVLPPAPGTSTSNTRLQIEEMVPSDGAYNVSTKFRTIVITFDESLDASTVTSDTVSLWKYPVLGYFDGEAEPTELQKKLTVVGNTIKIDF